jgi:serine/threonine protein kinase
LGEGGYATVYKAIWKDMTDTKLKNEKDLICQKKKKVSNDKINQKELNEKDIINQEIERINKEIENNIKKMSEETCSDESNDNSIGKDIAIKVIKVKLSKTQRDRQMVSSILRGRNFYF